LVLILLCAACGYTQAPSVPTTAPTNAPTAVPTSVAVSVATATSAAPTAAATTRPTLAATTAATTSAPSQSGVSAACNHPYYPVSATATWEYRNTTTGLPPSNFTQSETNVGANGFTEHRVFQNLVTDNTWRCDSTGLISTQFGNLSFTQGQFQMQTTKNTGVTIPPPSDWKVGTAWNYSYEIKGTMTAAGNAVNAQGTVDVSNKIVGQESVTVPAGTYNALKVESATGMKLSIVTGSVNMPMSIDTKSNIWFAQNVGMVKTQADAQGLVSTVELISFKP
ncbi:MAG: hypothetical protein LC737_01545, partial [Chloroflexi bacterium]|nr:hypothetical protein [Chloroflexota bacterium]